MAHVGEEFGFVFTGGSQFYSSAFEFLLGVTQNLVLAVEGDLLFLQNMGLLFKVSVGSFERSLVGFKLGFGGAQALGLGFEFFVGGAQFFFLGLQFFSLLTGLSQ